ncbi:DUF6187 family protein [Micromonospora sp. LOL_021]|uniref:DUF6187 family protein n=1 Tax=Micromonospora sp. LOL_021 TaxID=3345417 RepID=UPI003A871572
MPEPTYADPNTFDLPDTDADLVAEAGLVLMGLDAQRLLAVLGTAAITAHPGASLLAVDTAWHQGDVRLPFPTVVAAGVAQWRRYRRALAAADDGVPRSGAPREAWARTHATALDALGTATADTTSAALAVCWFRREEIDGFCDDR